MLHGETIDEDDDTMKKVDQSVHTRPARSINMTAPQDSA